MRSSPLPRRRRVFRVRDLVNRPRLNYLMQQRGGLWFQLCSAMDVVEDATFATLTYPEQPPPSRPHAGGWYLAVYGVLQALILQQDATRHIAAALEIPFDPTPYPVLAEVRTIRNNASGHPTKRDRQQPVAHYFLSRPSLTKASFTLLETTAEGINSRQDVDLLALIGLQQPVIAALLAGMSDELEQHEEAHRRAFMDRRLADAFDPMTGYYLEKIGEGVRRPDMSDIGLIGAELVLQSLDQFAAALAERGMAVETFPEVELLYGQARYAANQARRYLAGEPGDISTAAIASIVASSIVASYLREHLQALQEVVELIDRSSHRVEEMTFPPHGSPVQSTTGDAQAQERDQPGQYPLAGALRHRLAADQHVRPLLQLREPVLKITGYPLLSTTG